MILSMLTTLVVLLFLIILVSAPINSKQPIEQFCQQYFFVLPLSIAFALICYKISKRYGA